MGEILPRVSQAAAEGVGAKAVVVRVRVPNEADQAAFWPSRVGRAGDPELSIGIAYREESIGQIDVYKKPGDGVSSHDRRLIRLLASQAGAAFQNARLTFEVQARIRELVELHVELEASSERLVTAQMSVRRALGAEVDSAVGPHLARATGLLNDAEALTTSDRDRSLRLLEEAAAASDMGLQALRDVAHGIFSPILEQKGLTVALESQLAKLRADARLIVADEIRARRFPPEAEAAVYLSCVEIVKRLQTAGDIQIFVEEDRLVFKVALREGGVEQPMDVDSEWLHGLNDRLVALGGGLDLTRSPGRPMVIVGRVLSPLGTTATAVSI